MKLEYFADAFEGAGLLLFYAGTPLEVERLRGQVNQLGATPGTSIRAHALDFINAVDSCQLTLSSARRGRGALTRGEGSQFELQLDPSEWERMSDLLEPFCHPEPDVKGARFQYLHEHGGIEVIYSTAREW